MTSMEALGSRRLYLGILNCLRLFEDGREGHPKALDMTDHAHRAGLIDLGELDFFQIFIFTIKRFDLRHGQPLC